MNNTEKILAHTAQEAGMDQKTQEGLLKGMAVMIAEYEVMKAMLIELGYVQDTKPPLRWTATGEPLVNLEDVIRKHMKEKDHEGVGGCGSDKM